MRIAVYPGSFDPVSNGHLDIIERTSKIFDLVYVVVSINPLKSTLFTVDERMDMLKRITSHLHNVQVECTKELVINYAQRKQASVIIRGLRNTLDYQYEMTLFSYNQKINKDIETMLLFPSADNLFLSSSSIKELVIFGGNIDSYVPKMLVDEIKTRIQSQK